MADAFQVDPDALADAVERMSDFQRYAESMLSEIDSLVSNLHATWTGEGATAHAEAHRHWAQGEAMMREALAQLRAAAHTAHGNYTGAMAKNLSMWS
jgi:WXG100 family type VII secretion target